MTQKEIIPNQGEKKQLLLWVGSVNIETIMGSCGHSISYYW